MLSTEKDLRYYLMQEIKKQGTINPAPLNQWKFIPEDWAAAGRQNGHHSEPVSPYR